MSFLRLEVWDLRLAEEASCFLLYCSGLGPSPKPGLHTALQGLCVAHALTDRQAHTHTYTTDAHTHTKHTHIHHRRTHTQNTHTNTHMHTHAHTNTDTHTHTETHTHTRTHTHTHTNTHTHTHTLAWFLVASNGLSGFGPRVAF